jgi:hypothetical protein
MSAIAQNLGSEKDGRGADLSPAQVSVEPLPASEDLLMKREVLSPPRFSIRKPRSPRAGLSLFLLCDAR